MTASATTILGLNAYHGDASACLLVDGEVVAAVEEERFRRTKHWAGFPSESVRWCLQEAGLRPHELDHVAVNRDPSANLFRKVLHTLRHRPNVRAVADRLKNASRVRGLRAGLAEALDVDPTGLRAELHGVEHHRAHLASAYFVSPFARAAVASIDGFGDFSSSMWGTGEGNKLEVTGRVSFPHSLGLYYLALTQYLGFPRYGDEYKIMGLAAYGEPRFAGALRRLVKLKRDGRFELDLAYFRHHSDGVAMTWEGGEPAVETAFSPALQELLGPARRAGEAVEQRHRDLAASIQAVYEEALFHILGHLHERTGERRLCLAGGCAMNSLANGRIAQNTGFDELYIQAAAGDAGGALGAAAWVWCQELDEPRPRALLRADLGPGYSNEELATFLADSSSELSARDVHVNTFEGDESLCAYVAERIAAGDVVGWFQGRMEWGPRALGQRSILGDPRRADMREVLNLKIKRRESFRPFAPAILAEESAAWFEDAAPVPFMSRVFPFKQERRQAVPAVVHADGTGRLQTVSRETQPLFHGLIRAFADATGVPLLLNTSFNENEPVVCRPREALDCFLRTEMDLLVLGHHVVSRSVSSNGPE